MFSFPLGKDSVLSVLDCCLAALFSTVSYFFHKKPLVFLPVLLVWPSLSSSCLNAYKWCHEEIKEHTLLIKSSSKGQTPRPEKQSLRSLCSSQRLGVACWGEASLFLWKQGSNNNGGDSGVFLKTGFSQVLHVLGEPKGGTVTKQVNISLKRSL